MAHEAVHDLTAAYALDALDERERAEYEAHLATCEQCRAELASLQKSATSLAYAVPAPAPPPQLRERILDQARSERSNVVPLRPPRINYVLGAAAAVAAAIAVALGIWNAKLLDEREDRSVLTNPDARVIALPEQGPISGRLHVDTDGNAALVVDSAAAPTEKDYEIWVIEGDTPRPAGVFDGGRRIVRLSRPVPPGASVAVTLERDGGVQRPTTKPLFVVEA
jgi:anti-sigma-K factor RskA